MSIDKKIKISLPIVVEGKYDKNTLLQIFDARVIAVGGFGVFNSKEKQCLLRRLSEKGIILLTDSDGAGGVIRSFIKGIVPKEKVYNLYIPKLEGKERRKTKASKEGLIGVEGMNRETLLKVFAPFIDSDDLEDVKGGKPRQIITKVDFYKDKMTGAANSSMLRNKLSKHFGLPDGMSANALLEALNIIADRESYSEAIQMVLSSADA